MARQPATEARAQVAERQVDLVVQREDVVDLDAVGTTRGRGRLTDQVHVGLRPEQDDARAAGASTALGDARLEAILARGRSQRRWSSSSTMKPML